MGLLWRHRKGDYTKAMWRRLLQAFVLWLSLAGFIPAALACAQTMAERDCCPPGHKMPCEGERSSGNVEAAACCATPSLASSVVQAVSEQHALDVPALDAVAPCVASPTLPSSSARRYFKRSADPPDHGPDCSRIYLQTARLRL
jgi:hypothetical protein